MESAEIGRPSDPCFARQAFCHARGIPEASPRLHALLVDWPAAAPAAVDQIAGVQGVYADRTGVTRLRRPVWYRPA